MALGFKPRKDKDNAVVIKQEAFASKTTADGKSLYKRVHGATFNVPNGVTTICQFTIPYAHCKIEAMEIINATTGDSMNFKVLDTATNTYSGLDVGTYGANFLLNQFGFNVYPVEGGYTHQSQYDADLYSGMVVEIEYSNNDANTKDVYINYVLNEVK